MARLTTTNTPNYIYPKLIIHRIYFDQFWSIFIHHYPFLPISSIFVIFFPFHPRLSISTCPFSSISSSLSTLINFYPFRSFIHVYPFSSDIISFHPLLSILLVHICNYKCIFPNCIFPNCIFPNCIFPNCICSNCICSNCIFPNCIIPHCISGQYPFIWIISFRIVSLVLESSILTTLLGAIILQTLLILARMCYWQIFIEYISAIDDKDLWYGYFCRNLIEWRTTECDNWANEQKTKWQFS